MKVVLVCVYPFTYKIHCILIGELLHAYLYRSTNLKQNPSYVEVEYFQIFEFNK